MAMMEVDQQFDHFTALNDHCIIEIFDRLPLDDLYTLSVTCKKLKRLAAHYFSRKYAEVLSKTITITELSELVFWELDRDVKYFSNLFESVCISECKINRQLSQFMQMHCAKKLNRISFWYCFWCGSIDKYIQSILQTVEVVQLYSSQHKDVLRLNDVLNRCQQIKCLKVNHLSMRSIMPCSVCPTLEIFECDIRKWDGCSLNELTAFFLRNPSIKRFICNPDLACLVKPLLRTIISNSKIDELFMSLRIDWIKDLDTSLDQLKALDDLESFKRLELSIFSHDVLRNIARLRLLPRLKTLSGLHLYDMAGLGPFVATFQAIVNLKVLSLNSCFIPPETAIDLAQNLVKLEEIYFDLDQSFDITNLLMPFVQYTKKLYKIFVGSNRKHKFTDKKRNIPALNAERQRLQGACKLTIYLDKNFVGFCDDIGNEFVDVKLVSVKYSADVDSPNPLICYSFNKI